MKTFSNPAMAEIFDGYPKSIRKKMLLLRQLVFDTAQETEGIGEIEETLKWVEPSYIAKGGSTLRMDWKETNPRQYAISCFTRMMIYPSRL